MAQDDAALRAELKAFARKRPRQANLRNQIRTGAGLAVLPEAFVSGPSEVASR